MNVVSVVQTLGSFLLVLGILVFVHELGHFLAAKMLGIGVRVFALGFGPRVVGFRRGETDYRIAGIPLGGYVKLAGDETDEHRTGSSEEFLSRPKMHRFIVFVAGAAFNIAFALIVTWIALMAYGQIVTDERPVVAVVAPGSNAERAGIEVGDRVLTIEGRDAIDPGVELDEIAMSPNTTKSVVVDRDGERIEIALDTGADPKYKLGFPGWDLVQSDEPPLVGEITEGGAADRDGLLPGDRILSLDGVTGVDEARVRSTIAGSAELPLTLGVDRAGESLTVTVRPDRIDGVGKIGAYIVTPYPKRTLGAIEAIPAAFHENVERSSVLFKTLWRLVSGQISMRAMSGPIEIARFSRRAVTGGEQFLTFLAFISLQLGIINLLPIPVLDGGHILIIAVEGLLGRDLSERVKERVMIAGLVVLVGVFGVIFAFDILKAAV